jgi:CspA family cold shock protein
MMSRSLVENKTSRVTFPASAVFLFRLSATIGITLLIGPLARYGRFLLVWPPENTFDGSTIPDGVKALKRPVQQMVVGAPFGIQAEVGVVSCHPRQSADDTSAAKWQVERGFAMAKGTIRKLISDKGFGFIQAEEGKDLFFHRNELQGVDFSSLKEGQEVEYETGTGRGGRPQATKVKPTIAP